MGATYTIIGQKPKMYLDAGGELVSGFEIRALVHKWDEVFIIDVPRLDSTLIDNRLRGLIAEREKLDKLGV